MAGVDLGDRVAAAVGDPEVVPGHGDRAGVGELVPRPGHNPDQGPGGVEFGEPAAVAVRDPEVAAVDGEGLRICERVPWAGDDPDQGAAGGAELGDPPVAAGLVAARWPPTGRSLAAAIASGSASALRSSLAARIEFGLLPLFPLLPPPPLSTPVACARAGPPGWAGAVPRLGKIVANGDAAGLPTGLQAASDTERAAAQATAHAPATAGPAIRRRLIAPAPCDRRPRRTPGRTLGFTLRLRLGLTRLDVPRRPDSFRLGHKSPGARPMPGPAPACRPDNSKKRGWLVALVAIGRRVRTPSEGHSVRVGITARSGSPQPVRSPHPRGTPWSRLTLSPGTEWPTGGWFGPAPGRGRLALPRDPRRT